MEVLHDGSSRIYFLLEVFIEILLRSSSILLLVIRSAILSSVPLEVVLCHS